MVGLDDLQKIKDTDVKSVWAIFVSYVKRKYVISIILPVFVIILAGWLTYLTKIPHIVVVSIMLAFGMFAFFWQKAMGDFLKHFASDIGYKYEDSGDVSSVDGTIFDFGHNQNISKIVYGKYFDQDTRLFIFSTVVGSGKNKHTESYSALEIFFDTMLPNILLNNRKTWFNSMALLVDNEKKLTLEGDFQKYFTLYVTKEYELEATQIFTPEIMQMFIDKAGKISVEMYKNKVYLYYPNEITKKDQLVSIYSLAKEIILELGKKFSLMKDDVEDMSKYAKLT
ncbi:MAG: hypothetical protein NTY04_04160 [Candidatus Staskawiczbacteria bacterium]|nr:hypothetical protein [Candidatus Staskawiczbacteria bacterium]